MNLLLLGESLFPLSGNLVPSEIQGQGGITYYFSVVGLQKQISFQNLKSSYLINYEINAPLIENVY